MENNKNNSKIVWIISFLVIFFLGIFLGFNFKNLTTSNFNLDREQHEGITSEYKFINPLLQCNNNEDQEFQTFEHKINKLISLSKEDNKILDAAVYFRDLDTGQWLGIQQDTDFSPASLLKVPLMIALFKQAEIQPSLLNEKITFGENTILNTQQTATQSITDGKTVQKGKEYTISELINFMILNSDNMAKDLLGQHPMIEVLLKQPYEDLGIDISGVKGPEDFMTVKEYASFFRILYNASYLNREMSNRALNLLSQTTFNQGLVSGVPKGVVVSHKFGERGYQGVQQLHDCGIVYAPSRPYLLCIMTRGHDIKSLEQTIANLSKLVYDEVQSQSKKN